MAIADFTDERVRDEALRQQWEKITCDFSAPLGDGFDRKGARVVVRTTDGREHRAEQRIPPGSPANPLTENQLTEKFAECVTATDQPVDPAETLSVLNQLENEHRYEEFVALLARIRK